MGSRRLKTCFKLKKIDARSVSLCRVAFEAPGILRVSQQFSCSNLLRWLPATSRKSRFGVSRNLGEVSRLGSAATNGDRSLPRLL